MEVFTKKSKMHSENCNSIITDYKTPDSVTEQSGKKSGKSCKHNFSFVKKISNYRIQKKIPAKLIFIIIGFLSTIWFLVRVIPKPSRAEYPCMKAAYPFMSGFVIYLAGLASAMFAFRKSKESFINAKYITAGAFLLIAVSVSIFSFTKDTIPVYANSKSIIAPNHPIGVAKGIYPGRVVWIWDSTATDENIPLDENGRQIFGEGWFLPSHTNMSVVDKMVTDAILKLTGKQTIDESWDALFKYFNKAHNKGDVGYKDGEKIFIRTNQVSASAVNDDYSIKNTSRYGMAETSPQVVLAILRQLINKCGVKQENISLGDPMKHMYKHEYDMLHGEFPNVVYIDYGGTYGRTAPVANAIPSIYYSDRGTILKDGGTTGSPVYSDYLPTVITQADYLITIPAMKGHARGGVTLCGKIHFGSNLRGSATHLHGGLIAPNKASAEPKRYGYGYYRVQVDLMGHKDLGGKTVLFLVDGLWSGSEANDPPRKFKMAPFNNDWSSSIFVSQDQLAIESVCFDFLKAEFTEDNPYGSYPQIEGADEHILQAADSSYWPADIKYDPENDGTTIGSLGVFEHWNNPVNKQYSRNLKTGNGIELVYVNDGITAVSDNNYSIPNTFSLYKNYPNPFNPATNISFSTAKGGHAELKIYDILGNEITTLFNNYSEAGKIYNLKFNAVGQSSGIYIARLSFGGKQLSEKLMLA